MTTAPLFGIDVVSDLPLEGVEPAPLTGAAPPLRIVGAGRADVTAPFADAETLVERRDADGAVALRIAGDDARGWLIEAQGWGAFALDGAATLVRCAPEPMPAWRWQRYLIAQVLPWAAVVRGLEVLHASAVEVGGRAIAITGPSQAGKSTVAAAWLAAGARLVADDVVAITLAGGEPLVHPGPAILSVRPATAALVAGIPGRLIGEDEHGRRLAVPGADGPLRLGALVFVERSADAVGITVERVRAPDPRRLLGSTFNLALRSPSRLERLLDASAAIAARVAVLDARAGLSAPPGEIVAALTDAV
jgi:hypothetical protein